MKDKKATIEKYQPSKIEEKWQKKWAEEGIYKSDLSKKNKYYVLAEFAYPSGDLHLGHWFTFSGADIYARQKRMQGYQVFFPNGFDAFGLPAENAAIKRNIHPQDWTLSNIEKMKKQYGSIGASFTFDHEVITCLPIYYKWNQWIFLKMYEKGLAYQKESLSNWCPVDQTVLANEGIEDGKCWRCGSEVVQKPIKQWFLKITDYADRLLWPEPFKETKETQGTKGTNTSGTSVSSGSFGPSDVDWPKAVKVAQNQWIGKKEGIEITFDVAGSKEKITVFTTTPINFGATFLVVAPEHPIVKKITTPEHKKAVEEYVGQAKKKTERDRLAEVKDKTGVFTGTYVINHLNGKKLPVWVADYVLINYGTGAVQGCPAHDQRDFEFAQKFGIRIPRVVTGPNGETEDPKEHADQVIANVSKGKMINSDFLNGMEFIDAMEKTKDYFEEKGWGKRIVNYHLHDWSISRQRYWGTPVPMIHCNDCGTVPVSENQLPVELPYDVDYAPKGKPPLASNEEWLKVKCRQCGKDAERDPETLDTFFDSSWYFFRYLSPEDQQEIFDSAIEKRILPVDIYFGGAEHTLGHTLYSRFFTKFFKDLGLTKLSEYALKRVNHGVVLGPDGNRMSKSKGNVVNPDQEVKKYGADTIRVYLAFFIPYEGTGPWISDRVWGAYRFLQRVWGLQEKVQSSKFKVQSSAEDLRQMHRTIKKVTQEIEEVRFNTAVAALMEWLNHLSAKETVSVEEYETFLKLLAPFAPHMTEEIYHKLLVSDASQTVRKSDTLSIHIQPWPSYDEKYLQEDEVSIIVQINGKLRDSIKVHSSQFTVHSKVEEAARKSEKIQGYLKDLKLKKVIYVEGKVINFVGQNLVS